MQLPKAGATDPSLEPLCTTGLVGKEPLHSTAQMPQQHPCDRGAVPASAATLLHVSQLLQEWEQPLDSHLKLGRGALQENNECCHVHTQSTACLTQPRWASCTRRTGPQHDLGLQRGKGAPKRHLGMGGPRDLHLSLQLVMGSTWGQGSFKWPKLHQSHWNQSGREGWS